MSEIMHYLSSAKQPTCQSLAIDASRTKEILEFNWVDADGGEGIRILPHVFLKECPMNKNSATRKWQRIWNEELSENEKRIQFLLFEQFGKTNFDQVPEANDYFSQKFKEAAAARLNEKNIFGDSGLSCHHLP